MWANEEFILFHRMYPNGTEVARINKKPLILSNYYIPAEVCGDIRHLYYCRIGSHSPHNSSQFDEISEKIWRVQMEGP